MGSLEITDKEKAVIQYLRETSIPYGEVVIRFFFQDGVIVRAVEEDKKPSRKF